MENAREDRWTLAAVLSMLLLLLLAVGIFKALPGAVDFMLDDLEKPVVYIHDRGQ